MSNVSSREKTIRVVEVMIPNPATRRDVCDLLRVADQKYRQVHGHADDWSGFYDDAYTIEARDDETVAIIMIDPS